MSWEAYRWTAKSPSELFHILGPHGVDHLVRQALDTCWRELPEDRRTLRDAIAAAREVFERNVKTWSRIKKPEPAAFFEDLLPKPADQFVRQAMVTCWMMMPRTGGRKVGDVTKIVTGIFERNIATWEEDHATLTGKKLKKSGPAKVSKTRGASGESKRVAKNGTMKVNLARRTRRS